MPPTLMSEETGLAGRSGRISDVPMQQLHFLSGFQGLKWEGKRVLLFVGCDHPVPETGGLQANALLCQDPKLQRLPMCKEGAALPQLSCFFKHLPSTT